jgi:hypothetical protein
VSGYGNLIVEFAKRTIKNLNFIQAQVSAGDPHLFDVTQLWNSLLGLIVLPQERNDHGGGIQHIPPTPMTELWSQDPPWPHITETEFAPDHESLRDLVRDLRNAVAHFNVDFKTGPDNNPDDEITSVTVWTQGRPREKVPDYPGRPAKDPLGRPVKTGNYYWQGQMNVKDLELLARRIAELYVGVFV